MKIQRRVSFSEIRKLVSEEGKRVTQTFLYEQSHTTDGSEFVLVPDHPLGSRMMRIWPKKK